jgi:hypothetical protein
MALNRATYPVQYFLQIPRAADTSTLKTYAENMSEILLTRVYSRLYGVISHETTVFSFNLFRQVCVTERPVSVNTTEYHAYRHLASTESLPAVLRNV